MEGCCIKGCKNSIINENNNVACFKFPLHDKVLLQWWLKKINQADLKPAKHTQICVDHFDGNDINCNLYFKDIKLNPTAIPSIFPPQFEEFCDIDNNDSSIDNEDVDVNDNEIDRDDLVNIKEEDLDDLYNLTEIPQEKSGAFVDPTYQKLQKPQIPWIASETQTEEYCTTLPRQRNDPEIFSKTDHSSDRCQVMRKQQNMSMQIDECNRKPKQKRFDNPETDVTKGEKPLLKITIEKCTWDPSTRQRKRGRPLKKKRIVITPTTQIENIKDSFLTFNFRTQKELLKARRSTLNKALSRKEQNTEGYKSEQLSLKKSDVASIVPIDTKVEFTRDSVKDSDLKFPNKTTMSSNIQRNDYKSLVVKNLNAQKKNYASAVLLQHGIWKAEDEEFEKLIKDVRKLKEDAVKSQRKRQRNRHFIKGTTKAEDDEFETLLHDIRKIKQEIIKKKTPSEIQTSSQPMNSSNLTVKNCLSSNGMEIAANIEPLGSQQQKSVRFSETSDKTMTIKHSEADNKRCSKMSSMDISSSMKNNVRGLDGIGNSSIKITAPVEKSSPVVLASLRQIFTLADQKNPKSFQRSDEGEVICEVKEESSDDFTLEFNTDQELMSDSELDLTNNSDPDLIIT